MPVEVKCCACGASKWVKPSQAKKLMSFSCSGNSECRRKQLSMQTAGERNPAYGKTYRTKETHPEWAANIASTCVERGVNVGDRNAMKRPEVAAQVSATRKRLFAQDPSMAAGLATRSRQAWADGKYDGVRVGQSDWYNYRARNGQLHKCQGTYELALARWLDLQGLTFTMHKGRIPYIGADGHEHSYYPDFYVEEWDCYIDPKADKFAQMQHEKFEHIYASNLGLKLWVLTQHELKGMGIEFDGCIPTDEWLEAEEKAA